MINYLKNNKINNILNNINKSNNYSIKNDSNIFNFNIDFSRDNRRNRVNIFEEHSKLINSRHLLNIKKNKDGPSSQNSFDKDIKKENYISFNSNNNNIKNSRSHNKKKDLLYKIKMHSLNENTKTITYESILKKKEDKSKTLINFNFKKISNKDGKYIKYKKDIFEKVSKKIIKKNEINIEDKKLKIKENKNNIKENFKSLPGNEIINNAKNDDKINIINKTDDNKYINKIEKEKEKEKVINFVNEKEKKDISKNKNFENNNKNDKKEIIEQIIKENPLKINTNLEKNNEKKENKEKNNKNNEINDKNKNESENNKFNINIKKEIREKEYIENEERKNDKNQENNNKEIKIISIEKKVKSEEFNYNYYEEEDSEPSYFDITKIKEDSQIPKEYINIIYKNLLIEEEKALNPKPIYKRIKSQIEINEQMRSILVDWIIDVHYKFGFTDETLFMTILIIDRYISTKFISKLHFQLLGITALLISCKHEEINLPKVDDFIYITDNAYTKDEVFLMENKILNIFNFELLYPSPIKFFEFLTLRFNFNKKQYLMGKYLMETFLIDLKWINYRPSVIACSCAYIVMKFYKMENYQEAYNRKYYNIDDKNEDNKKYNNENDIKECAKDICFCVDNINKTNFLSCRKKYANEENEKISLIVEGKNS